MPQTINEFSRFANSYNTYNIIQTQVAKELIEKVPKAHYSKILDIGCGSGAIYRNLLKQNISFDAFEALDASVEMLSLHPRDKKISIIEADFNKKLSFLSLAEDRLILSSSALQWSVDLDNTFAQLSALGKKAYFSIFTANTFQTLHQTAQLHSPIYDVDTLKVSIEKYYDARYQLKKYQLQFKTTQEMFTYIKKSGVSGGSKQLSYKELKELIREYPLDYLEFEILFVEATSLA